MESTYGSALARMARERIEAAISALPAEKQAAARQAYRDWQYQFWFGTDAPPANRDKTVPLPYCPEDA